MKKKMISEIYPITKLWVVATLILIGFLFRTYVYGYLIVLPFTILVAFLNGSGKAYLKKVIAAMLFFVVFYLAFKIMLDVSESKVLFQWKFITIKQAGLVSGLNESGLIMVFAATFLIFFETTDMLDFMISLNKLGLSHVGSYVALSTLQMIPEMGKKSKVIMQAQQARGIETTGNVLTRMKAFIPAIGPLIISSITDLEDRAVTLEVRAFSSENPKSFYRELPFRTRDRVIIGVFSLLLVICITWRVLLWLK